MPDALIITSMSLWGQELSHDETMKIIEAAWAMREALLYVHEFVRLRSGEMSPVTNALVRAGAL
jgi:hypothetical protein